MLGQMTGYDNLDIYSVPSTPEDYVKAMHQPVKAFRLGTPRQLLRPRRPRDRQGRQSPRSKSSPSSLPASPRRPRSGTVSPATASATPRSITTTSSKIRSQLHGPPTAPASPASTTLPPAPNPHRRRRRPRQAAACHDPPTHRHPLHQLRPRRRPTTRQKSAKINETLALESKAGASASGGPPDNKVYDWSLPAAAAPTPRPSTPTAFGHLRPLRLHLHRHAHRPHDRRSALRRGQGPGPRLRLPASHRLALKKPPLTPNTPVPPIIEGPEKPDKSDKSTTPEGQPHPREILNVRAFCAPPSVRLHRT